MIAQPEKKPATQMLVVIDQRIDAVEMVIDHVAADARVLLIDETTDAWAAIAAHGEQFGRIKTLAVFAHGGPGRIELGAQPLTEHALKARAAEMMQDLVVIGFVGAVGVEHHAIAVEYDGFEAGNGHWALVRLSGLAAMLPRT